VADRGDTPAPVGARLVGGGQEIGGGGARRGCRQPICAGRGARFGNAGGPGRSAVAGTTDDCGRLRSRRAAHSARRPLPRPISRPARASVVSRAC
jgi:hypothetical protein